MQIDGLLPMQNWMERIHSYLGKGEHVKARLAALAIPVFSSLACLGVIRQICFKGANSEGTTFKNKLVKVLCLLSWNILFAPYYGVRSPQKNYQMQKYFGFTSLEIPVVKLAEKNFPPAPQEELLLSPLLEEKVPISVVPPIDVPASPIPVKMNASDGAIKAQMVKSPLLPSPVLDLANRKMQVIPGPLPVLPKLNQENLELIDQSSGGKVNSKPDSAELDLPPPQILKKEINSVQQNVTPVDLPPQDKSKLPSSPEPVPQVKFAQTFVIEDTVRHATVIRNPQSFVNTAKREEPPAKGIAARIAQFSAKNLEKQPIDKPFPKLEKKADEVPQVQQVIDPAAEERKADDFEQEDDSTADPTPANTSDEEKDLIEEFNAQPVTKEGLPAAGLPVVDKVESEEKKALKSRVEKLLKQSDIPIEPIRFEKPKTEVDQGVFAPISCLFNPRPMHNSIFVKKIKNQETIYFKKVKSKKGFKVHDQTFTILNQSVSLLDQLTLDQIKSLRSLRNNLRQIHDHLKDKNEPLKSGDILRLIDDLNTRELILWIEEDYHKGLLEVNCRLLAKKIIEKIKQGDGRTGINQRLFRQTAPQDTHSKITAWRSHETKKQNNFTVYDWYAILSRYIENFPAKKLELFAPFKTVDSVERTIELMNKLPLQDQAVVANLLILQRTSLDNIWAPEDQKITGKAGMFSSAKGMLTSNIINKLLSPSSKIPEGITGIAAEMHANTPNVEFLAELIADYMPERG